MSSSKAAIIFMWDHQIKKYEIKDGELYQANRHSLRVQSGGNNTQKNEVWHEWNMSLIRRAFDHMKGDGLVFIYLGQINMRFSNSISW